MKKYFFVLFVVFFFFSCSTDYDFIVTEERIIGEWQLIESRTYVENEDGWSVGTPVSYEQDQIFYTFEPGKKLTVSSNHPDFLEGVYEWEFKNAPLGSPNEDEQNFAQMIIDERIYMLGFDDDLMSLDRTYVDETQLIFVRVK